MSAARLRSFRTPAAFRAWLAKNHARQSELVLRCFKVHVAHRGVTYRQALEEALCFGWIDGVRRGVDEVSFSVRFTPRKPRSIWSRVNIGIVKRLVAEGRMAGPGRKAFEARDPKRTALYSFETGTVRLTGPYAATLRANRKAAAFFRAQAPWYQRTASHWILSARREETRRKRLGILVESSAQGLRVPPLRRPGQQG